MTSRFNSSKLYHILKYLEFLVAVIVISRVYAMKVISLSEVSELHLHLCPI